MRCERCGGTSSFSTGSWFNTEQICLECAERERAHPRFEEARRVEREAVRNGDFNFPGIGLPSDLRGKEV